MPAFLVTPRTYQPWWRMDRRNDRLFSMGMGSRSEIENFATSS